MRGEAQREVILELFVAPQRGFSQPAGRRDNPQKSVRLPFALGDQAAWPRLQSGEEKRRGIANLGKDGIRMNEAGPERRKGFFQRGNIRHIMWVLFALFAAGAVGRCADNVVLPTAAEDIARGRKLFMGACTYCHGPTGDGGKGADLSRRDLTNAKSDGDLVRIIEAGLPGTEMPGSMHMTQRELAQTAAFVRSLSQVNVKPVPGNPERGRAIYAKHGCASCHTTPGSGGGAYVGGLMGPDLSIIGSRRNAVHLRESLVAPAASLPANFIHTTVTLAGGRQLTGQRVNEDTFMLVLRDFTGQNHILAKDEVRSIVKDRQKSPMPSYQGKLTPAELDDLVAYLVSLQERR